MEPEVALMIGNGYGTETPIHVSGTESDGTMRLTAEQARDLARALRQAADAVNVMCGEIADVRIFDHALSDDAIKELYERGSRS